MRVILFKIVLFSVFFLHCSLVSADARKIKDNEFLVIVYHAIMDKPKDVYSVSKKDFVEHLEYLKTHGFTPISMDDLLKAKNKEKPLPPQTSTTRFR